MNTRHASRPAGKLARRSRSNLRSGSGVLLLLAGVLLGLCPVLAQEQSVELTPAFSREISSKYRQLVVDRVCESLDKNFVYADRVDDVIAHIRGRLKDGAYDDFTRTDRFGAALTHDLESFTGASHIGVWLRAPSSPSQQEAGCCPTGPGAVSILEKSNFGFKAAEILPGNIGYVEMTSFTDANLGRRAALSAIGFVAATDAVIIDLRSSVGGYDSMVQLLASCFLDAGHVLHRVYDRNDQELLIAQTYPVDMPEKLKTVPLYILTSDFTRSAAEAFAYTLKHLGRAVIVGETTAGAGLCAVTDDYDLDVFKLEVMLPTMQTINARTGSSWEATGVRPEIETPVDQALEVTLKDIADRLRLP